jgi:hypothetical protein
MKILTLPTVMAVVLLTTNLHSVAQVSEIKSASKGGGRGHGEGGGGGGGGSAFAFDIFFYSIDGLASWQRHTLLKRDSIPSLVSFEAGFQTAAQPSSYYIINPRIRGNWGLFSTDFRINYLIEESVEGPIHLRTVDWQVVQLNVITTKDVNLRLGGGIMHEAYGNYDTHTELTAAFQLLPRQKKLGGSIEYRAAEVRKEVNGGIQYSLGSSGTLHWYATVGAVFQRYYSSINVWGIQAGVSLKIF